jgi:hypothetical protein
MDMRITFFPEELLEPFPAPPLEQLLVKSREITRIKGTKFLLG